MRPYYEEGGVVIYHGDCRDVLPSLDLACALVLTDPPYGIAHDSGRGASWKGTQIEGDHSTALRDRVLDDWGRDLPAIVFGTWKTPRPARTRAVLIWGKGPASGMGDLAFPWKLSFEEIYIIGDGAWRGSRDEGVLRGHIQVTWESQGRFHPNQKPVSLFSYLIGKTSPPVIVDPFAGSGTTLVAAKRLGRRAIGIEIEEKYCEIAADRLRQAVLPFEPAPEPEPVSLFPTNEATRSAARPSAPRAIHIPNTTQERTT